MGSTRGSWLVLLLLAGLLAALPGIADGIERLLPGDDCTEDCPADSAEGKCGSSCDQCTCCARTMSAVFSSCPGLGVPGRIEAAAPCIPSHPPLVLSAGVYHPPRA